MIRSETAERVARIRFDRADKKIFRERLGSPEAKEAMSAFLQKRKPDFSRF